MYIYKIIYIYMYIYKISLLYIRNQHIINQLYLLVEV